MEEKQRIYIPVGLKVRAEFFSGFGKEEAIVTLTVMAATAGVEVILYLFLQSLLFVVVSCIAVLAATVMAVSRDGVSNVSMVDQIRYMIRFGREPKEYRYMTAGAYYG